MKAQGICRFPWAFFLACITFSVSASNPNHTPNFYDSNLPRHQAAVLVAIAIPIFTSQLEKSREATDAANIRSAYAAVQAAALLQDNQTDFSKNDTADATFTVTGSEGSYVYKAEVTLKQTQDEWQSGAQDIGGVSLAANTAKANGTATITYTQSTGETTITIAE